MNLYFKILSTALALLFIFCNKEQNQRVLPTEYEIPEIERKLVDRSNDIGFEYFKYLNQANSSENNLLLSPTGISFSIFSLFETSASETRNEIKRFLRIMNLSDSSISNGYDHMHNVLSALDKGINYSDGLDFAFSSELDLSDKFLKFLEKRKHIKSTFESNSGFITDVSLKIPDKTIPFQLINSVSFKAFGKYQKKVQEAPFYSNPDKTDFIQMIVSEADYNYYGDANIKAVEIPLGQGNYNMLVILPKNMEILNEFANEFNMKILKRIREKSKIQHLEVFMPKLNVSIMQSCFPSMKMSRMNFINNPLEENFSLINDSSKFFLSDFEQILDLNFNYQSNSGLDAHSGLQENSEFNKSSFFVDHPFIFVIYEKCSDAVLFIGRIQNP